MTEIFILKREEDSIPELWQGMWANMHPFKNLMPIRKKNHGFIIFAYQECLKHSNSLFHSSFVVPNEKEVFSCSSTLLSFLPYILPKSLDSFV